MPHYFYKNSRAIEPKNYVCESCWYVDINVPSLENTSTKAYTVIHFLGEKNNPLKSWQFYETYLEINSMWWCIQFPGRRKEAGNLTSKTSAKDWHLNVMCIANSNYFWLCYYFYVWEQIWQLAVLPINENAAENHQYFSSLLQTCHIDNK